MIAKCIIGKPFLYIDIIILTNLMSIYKPFCRKAHRCIAFNILYLMSYFTVSGIKVLSNNVDLKTRLMMINWHLAYNTKDCIFTTPQSLICPDYLLFKFTFIYVHYSHNFESRNIFNCHLKLTIVSVYTL